MLWVEVRVAVAAEAAEAVAARLRDLGAAGVAEEESAVVAWLAVGAGSAGRGPGPAAERREWAPDAEGREWGPDDLVRELEDFLRRLPAYGLDPGRAGVSARVVDDADWRDTWKEYFRPHRVGRHLLIRPPWAEAPEDWGSNNRSVGGSSREWRVDGGARDRQVTGPADGGPVTEVVIDPAEAFGTGTHATTRTALEMLERAADILGLRRGRVWALDLGTGSGILAIAAAKLGLGRVTALDDDPVAVEAARANVRANGVADRVEVLQEDVFEYLGRLLRGQAPAGPSGAGGGGRPGGSGSPGVGSLPPGIGLALANLTTDLVCRLAGPLAGVTAPGGLFVAAGVSAGEGEARVAEAAREAGWRELGRRGEEGWATFLFARRPRVLLHTLGCKVNLYDTGRLMEDLREAGWEPVTPATPEGCPLPVDAVVVNSCAVTARAEAKSRQLVRRVRREHPGAVVALVGCYPQLDPARARDETGADVVLGVTDRHRLAEALTGALGEAAGADRERAPGGSPAETCGALRGPSSVPGAFAGEATRATLKVQDGCDQRCSYCVIPLARGPSRSRPAAEVVAEAERLVALGLREIVVAGIHLGAWGKDLTEAEREGLTLPGLVRRLADIPGLARVRLSSIEPGEVGDDLIELLATHPKVCRHLHVPLQSGSDRILRLMNRHYTAAEYLGTVERARRAVPLLGLTTDVLVGFPGETDEDFRATCEVVRKAGFARLHVFRYSRRPGTPAAGMPGQVPAEVKRERSLELIRLGEEVGFAFRRGLVGLVLEVLVERVRPGTPGRAEVCSRVGASGHPGAPGRPATAEGLTDNYQRVVFPAETGSPGTEPVAPGDLVAVRVVGVTGDGLEGERAEV
ncbi:MAG: tRNA (N(6)-L-threonylcarbamoyladenosine(37)-C(2))-methylthiotransferase MtaB [Firmicutes bacterium]|nr:tRNA (N(6)-L-threonylcarbamoyladenosine(37)-C(2))-methylthiotransferase MtaB [Bacillota bacterium]